MTLAFAAGCGGGGDSEPEIATPQQQERFCTYFKAHRRESRQQLIGGLIKVAPKAIKRDLENSFNMNEAGYEATKHVQAYIVSTCRDAAPELSTP